MAKYNLMPSVSINNAQADGASTNVVDIMCLDDQYLPARGVELLFKVDGSAQIAGTIGNIHREFTDGNGVAHLKLTDKVAETVTVSVSVIADPDSKLETTVDFIEAFGPLKISEVVNTNHTFYNVGEPTFAWPGASFMIRVEGGSGLVNWKVTQSSAEVTIDSSPTGDAVVVIRNKPRQICELTGVDEVTKEKVTYSFYIQNFVASDTKKMTINSARSTYGDNLLSPNECRQLFDQWGNLGQYAVWNVSDKYWTNKVDLFSAKAFDFKKGVLSDESTVFFPSNYVVYRLGI